VSGTVRLHFDKMHGAGNDFVLVDCRDGTALDQAAIRLICDRHRGVGCDQLLTIEPARRAGAALAYGIWNADGSPAGQCGNGARCVAAWARRAGLVGTGTSVLDSPSGPVEVRFGADWVEVDMGRPDFAAGAAGFSGAETDVLVDEQGRRWPFAVVSMGNPHAVIEVQAAADAPVEAVGRQLQRDPRFADSCNVGFAEVVDSRQIVLRVFERGVGETLACGSGACAAVAVLQRAGRLAMGAITVDLPGGQLTVERAGSNPNAFLRGPATFVFEGVIEP